jgi:Tannase and feruloyl esterase
MSASGRVSRASPVHTVMRNCSKDEGRPFGFGDREPIPSHRKLPWSKAMGERCGNVRTVIPAGMVERGERKRTAAELGGEPRCAEDFCVNAAYPQSATQFMGAVSTELSRFQRHGGKIIIYDAVNDGIFSAVSLTRWYREMDERTGNASGFTRLYLVPNMAHCGGGPATANIRADGRKIHPVHLYETKKPAESSRDWDYFKEISTVPADQTIRPLGTDGCALVKGWSHRQGRTCSQRHPDHLPRRPPPHRFPCAKGRYRDGLRPDRDHTRSDGCASSVGSKCRLRGRRTSLHDLEGDQARVRFG